MSKSQDWPIPGSKSTSSSEDSSTLPKIVIKREEVDQWPNVGCNPFPFNFNFPSPASSSTSVCSDSSYILSTGSLSTTVHSDTSPVIPDGDPSPKCKKTELLTEVQLGFFPTHSSRNRKLNLSRVIMSDDESSSYEQVSSSDALVGSGSISSQSKSPVNSTSNIAAQSNVTDSYDYTTLAGKLIAEENCNFNFNTEKEALIKNSCVNAFRYGKSKQGLENIFFDTIKMYGGPELQPLLEHIEKKGVSER